MQMKPKNRVAVCRGVQSSGRAKLLPSHEQVPESIEPPPGTVQKIHITQALTSEFQMPTDGRATPRIKNAVKHHKSTLFIRGVALPSVGNLEFLCKAASPSQYL